MANNLALLMLFLLPIAYGQQDPLTYTLDQINNDSIFVSQITDPFSTSVEQEKAGIYYDTASNTVYVFRGIATDTDGKGNERIYVSYSEYPFTIWTTIQTPVINITSYDGNTNPSVIVVDDGLDKYLYIYYENIKNGKSTSISVSRVKTSHDTIIDPNSYEYVGTVISISQNGFDSNAIEKPSAIVINNNVYLYYTATNSTNIYSVGLAYQTLADINKTPYFKSTQLKDQNNNPLYHPLGYYDDKFELGHPYMIGNTMLSISNYDIDNTATEIIHMKTYTSTDGIKFTVDTNDQTINGSANFANLILGWIENLRLYYIVEDLSDKKLKVYYIDAAFLLEEQSTSSNAQGLYTTRGLQLLAEGDIFGAANQPFVRLFGPMLPLFYASLIFTISAIIYIKSGLVTSIIWSLFALGVMLPLLNTQLVNIGYGLIAAAAAALISKLILQR